MRWVILDTETTGLNPDEGHRVIEIGAVEVVNRSLTGRDFHAYLNPDRESDPGALEVHGLTTEFLSDKPRFADRVDEFLAFIEGAEVIIHNAPFDVKFLDAELKLARRDSFSSYCEVVTDSLVHAKLLHPGKRNSLDALCDRYGISNAHRTLHGALLDSQLLAEVWLAMTRGQDSLAIDEYNDESRKERVNHTGKHFDLPVILPGDQELQAHEAYLAGLEKAAGGKVVWRSIQPHV